MKLTPTVDRILRLALIEAERDESVGAGVKHLLIAMLQDGKNCGALMLVRLGVTIDELRDKPVPPNAALCEVADKTRPN